MKRTWRILVLFIAITQSLFSDNLDSLRTVLKKTNHNDTNRINLLLRIGELEGIFRVSYWDSIKKECEAKLKTSGTQKNFYLKRLGTITNDLGFVADELGDMTTALKAFEEAKNIFIQLNDKKSLARAYNNLGTVYDEQGNFNESIDNHYKSLKIREQSNDIAGMTSCYINIGFMYHNQQNYKKAIEFYEKGSEYALKAKLSDFYAVAITNIGLSYSESGDNEKALKNYLKAKSIQDTINDPIHWCNTINNIGYMYKIRKNYKLALQYYQTSLRIADSLDYKRGKAVTCSNLAEIYLYLGDIDKARSLSKQGFEIAQEVGHPREIGTSASVLSLVDERTGNFKDALKNYKLAQKMTDSLNNDEAKRKALQKEFQYKYDKKTAADSLNMVLERTSNELRSKEEKNKRLFLYGGLVVLIFVTLFVFNRLRITKKQNEIIAKQKLEVESQNELIVKQKELVEEKQKEIVDSINYAKRIQQAVLTGNEVWQKIAKDHFILFQPKDIVSGDFYWATNTSSNISIFALADCTGHGVPGGFMSMLGNSFLNEIVVEQKIYKPDQILNQLRNKIIKALAQEGQSNQKDGMDICLCAYDKNQRTLDFAGANNPLWIVNSNEITEYKGDKMPIGVYVNEIKPFSNTTIDLKDGDCLYLITDGFADQFGGEKGKKFKYKPLMELLQKNHHRSMNEQGDIFLSVINEWKKGYEQVDDISLIGIRI